MRFFFAAVLLCTAAYAQWSLQTSNTTASLRGISSLGQEIAWASGNRGTILRTVNGGNAWHACAVPDGGENLDFRGIQALSKDRAMVMSSGTGALSRIYQTVDGCQTWTLVFTNPDKEGFFDSILLDEPSGNTFVLGDPVNGSFALFLCDFRGGQPCSRYPPKHSFTAAAKQAAFAASNSLLTMRGKRPAFITGGSRSELIARKSHVPLPFPSNDSGGAFSIAEHGSQIVVVGGDYKLPNKTEKTAAFSSDGGRTFSPALPMPSGYRSAVGYDPIRNLWISVGPNGTDTSEDGRRWYRFAAEPNSEDKDWNALSLPFVVGVHGRIGKINFKSD